MFVLTIIAAVATVLTFAAANLIPRQPPAPPVAERSSRADGEITRAHPRQLVTRRQVRLFALLPALLTVVFAASASVYTQAPGEAKVVINLGGTVAGVDITPGIGIKAPWQSLSSWDLLSQTATYAGTDQATPTYTEGNVQGREVTVSLARGIQSNVDAQMTYSLTADSEILEQLYSRFRTQESFTRQVIQPVNLSTMREAPGALTPSQFRGEMRDDVEKTVTDDLNAAFAEYGVIVERVNLQDIRFSGDVEDSLRAVEVAQQREAEASANLRATTIEAQAQVVQAKQAAEAAIARAQGEAEANRLLSESLTPQVLQQRYIDALGEGTVYVVPEGSTPLVGTR